MRFLKNIEEASPKDFVTQQKLKKGMHIYREHLTIYIEGFFYLNKYDKVSCTSYMRLSNHFLDMGETKKL